MLRERCANDNHGRSVVTVRFCPSCGSVVNARIPVPACRADKHAGMRRTRSTYCVDCGDALALAGSRR